MKTWLLIGMLALAACAQQSEPHRESAITAPAQPQPVAPQPSPVEGWLGEARNAHSNADRTLAPGEREIAIAQLRAAAALEAPAPVSTDDAAAVKRGLYAHAAKLALELGHAKDAEGLIAQGLALPGNDAMRAQLLLLTVEVARERGDKKAEAHARKQARAELGED